MTSGMALKVGVFGVGAIGRTLATALDQRRLDATLVGLADQDQIATRQFAAQLATRPPVIALQDLIHRSDLVVEAASQAALPEFVPKALSAGRDILVMSVGGLLSHQDWFSLAEDRGCRIYVPSGAIAGLDGIKSASIGHLQSVVLTSRKPIAALKDTHYVLEKNLRLESFYEETVIFEGSAEEAAHAFPATSNVAASLRLAVERTVPVLVRVIAVPGGSKNVHEIRVQGEFGKLSVDVENVPSRSNPRTSQLAAFSALATLGNLTRSLRVGT